MKLIVGLILGGLLGFGFGFLAADSIPKCALDRTGKQMCVQPMPEGPNRMVVEP